MPKFQSNVLLQGFQLIDFCIENAVSLEGLSDINKGRKVFLTGNDTNIGYLRENIWDGKQWRAAAYLDDLTSFKDEDFQQLKEKVDTLIGDGVDMDGIIESWKEVEAFLEGISDKQDLVTLLDDKLSKSEGGTISGNITVKGLSFFNKRLSMREGAIIDFFKADGNIAGILGPYSANNYALSWYDGSSWNTLLHSGNVGEYTAGAANHLNSTEVSGEGSDNILDDIFTRKSGISVNIARNLGSGSLFVSRDTIVVNYSWGGRYGQQWAIEDTSHKILVRTKNADQTGAEWSDWKALAFTDSTVAAANRLVDSNNSAVVHIGGSGFYVGDNTYKTLPTSLMGNRILFRTGESATTAMTITDGGNVEVAGANNAYTRKLAVGVGGAHIIATTTNIPVLGTPANGSLLVGSVHYGLQIGTDTNSEASFIQAQRFNSADAKTLNLNPLGGAVNVGSGGLRVAEKVIISKDSLNTKVAYVGTSGGANYIWGYDTNNYLCIGAQGTTLTRATSSMVVESNAVSPGTNNAVSLGKSSYRWSNVYSVEGDFSGNVRIANAYGLLSTTTGGSVVQMIGIGKNNALFVGTDACIVNNMSVNVYGSIIRFYTGASLEERVNAMTLTSNGLGIFNNTIVADKYNGQGNIAGAAIVINKSGRRFGIGASSDDITSISLGLVSDEYGTWSTEHIIIESSGLATFNGGALIPTWQKLTIGSVTFEEDADGRIKVDGNLYTTGTLASGGKAKEGSGSSNGHAAVRDFILDPAVNKSVFECDHQLNTTNVIVQVFEYNSLYATWDMVIPDINITSENKVTVIFGRTMTQRHRVHIIGGNAS